MMAMLGVLVCLQPWAANAEERSLVPGICELADGGSATITAALDATSLALDDGRVIRLAGINAPPSLIDPAIPSAEMRALIGQSVEIRIGDVAIDRYGRTLAHVYASNGEWLQATILAAGHAVVASILDDRQCLTDLLVHERLARDASRGLWAEYAVPDAWSDAIRTGSARFALVEARIVSLGRTSRTVYLNTGRNWSTDFTVTFALDDADIVEADSGPLDQLIGSVIRVRGWLSQRDGPWIRLDLGEQIELLSVGDAGTAN